MKTHIEPPVGIILTMPVKFLEATGRTGASLEKELLDTFAKEDGYWIHMLKNLPTQDFLYVYYVFDGLVQLRANLMCLERKKTYKFFAPNGGSKTFENKNWVLACGPAVSAPDIIPMKGFQGFRYVYKELF